MTLLVDERVTRDADQFRRSFTRTALAAGAGAAVLFFVAPEIDLQAARLFYAGDGQFAGRSAGGIVFLRWLFICLYFSCIGLAIAGIAFSRTTRRRWLGLTLGRWLFVAACLGAGPGLVANLALKDQWGRARPKQVAEFGGQKAFTPPLVLSTQCRRNCSFVSGEASSVFIVFYAAALALPQWSIPLAAAGTVGGLVAGMVRMAQGAHFLSDVIFAGVFMALTALVIHRLMFGDRPTGIAPEASLRRRPRAAMPT